MKKIINISLLLLCVLVTQGCSVIDDDLSTCARDLELNIEVKMHTKLDLQLDQQLNSNADNPVRRIIYNQLADIFTDHAHDINVTVFEENSSNIAHNIDDVIDSNQSTYPISLRMANYDALALANLDDNAVVNYVSKDNHGQAMIEIPTADVSSQRTGLFAARKHLTITGETSQTIQMTLTQINSAVSLIIDAQNISRDNVEVFVQGTASGFMMADSVFLFDKQITTRADLPIDATPRFAAPDDNNTQPNVNANLCFTAVTLPSSDTEISQGCYYKIIINTTNADATVTHTELSVPEQLPAGRLKIIKTQMQSDGRVLPTENTNIGVTVKLDWNDGGQHDVEL
ncbi:MAG TPA: hypothetical protein DEO38_01405 [Bacteroidales bacterium]|nr:hypothetical protein [Bacteroidales bacterium]